MFDYITYGISFPFNVSNEGTYLKLTSSQRDEIRSNLVHLLLTRKGTRYFMPDFGTNLYSYLFEQMDSVSFKSIETEIRETVKKYIPKLNVTNISITPITNTDEIETDNSSNIFNINEQTDPEYTVKVRVDYVINDSVFQNEDFVILNI